MKKLALILSLFVATATVSVAETSIQIFTSRQANKVIDFLNANPEILLYCGCYPGSATTYVYTTDVWKESTGLFRYEVWIYGFDVVTNEVISTPIDLNCVWINRNGYPVSVARLLGYTSDPCNVGFMWTIPAYRPMPRVPHPKDFRQTYFFRPDMRPYSPKRHPGHGPAYRHTPQPHHRPAHKPAPAHKPNGPVAPPPAHNNRHKPNNPTASPTHNNRPNNMAPQRQDNTNPPHKDNNRHNRHNDGHKSNSRR
ncbi:MAG: hypothetical protein J5605_05940 [Bacteroidales bacterium]|nr:hypothetical protein [Bacteroidales bacterium]